MEKQKIRFFLSLLVTAMVSEAALAASAEIWPGDRRIDKTEYCYGNDWNTLFFAIYPSGNLGENGAGFNGACPFELPNPITEDMTLELTLPRAVECLGYYVRWNDKTVNQVQKTEQITDDGKEYTRIRIPLGRDYLVQRLERIKNKYNVHIWYQAPETLNDKMSWTLSSGGKTLVSSTLQLVTAGVVKDGRKLPKRFGFYPYGWYDVVPDGNYDKMSDFYRRFGITGIETYLGVHENESLVKMLEANRRHGVKNMANMGPSFCSKFGKKLDMIWAALMPPGSSLISAMDTACAGLESEEAKQYLEKALPLFDIALYDWEAEGPATWPGYDDAPTVAAFAKAQGITGTLTPELLKTRYREAYARFRMEQTARPLHSVRKTINAVKPMPLQVDSGMGLRRPIDYDVFARDVDILRPMIYLPPLGYARDVLAMLKSTTVPAGKFAPDITIGWPEGGLLTRTPADFLLNTMVTAASGCGSLSHWPGIFTTDASWFGIHEGLARIALVEDFYFDGAAVNDITVTGIAYRVKKIDLGYNKTLDLSAPDWREALIGFTHKLHDEYLFTILNYHAGEDAFVILDSPVLANLHLVDPVSRTYQTCDSAGKAVVRVVKRSPLLLIATGDAGKIAGLKFIESDTVKKQFDAAKGKYLKANLEGAIKLGRVGKVGVSYSQTAFGGQDRVCLQVRTPDQSVSFGDGGGRIYAWEVKDMSAFVAGKTYRTDGFGMDLLWLPVTKRWSGDETSDMKLAECRNDGKEARVVYEGEFKKGYPGLKIRKEYTIPASGSSIDVAVTLTNTLSTPVTVSYWQHNVLASTSPHFVGEDILHADGEGESVFTAKGLSEELRGQVVRAGKIMGTTGHMYAEYFPESGSGLIFKLPENFMNVYRWNSISHGVSGSEWMSLPLDIPAGGSETLQYTITAVPKKTPEALREQLK